MLLHNYDGVIMSVLKKLRNTEEVEDEIEELKVCCNPAPPPV